MVRGHSIGNHTQRHLNGSRTNTKLYLEDIKDCQDTIKDVTQFTPKVFRPPYGRIKLSQIRKIKSDFDIIMWTVLSGDFDSNLPPQKCVSKTISASSAGSIVVFHDNIKAEKNLKAALPDFLRHFKDLGFKFRNI